MRTALVAGASLALFPSRLSLAAAASAVVCSGLRFRGNKCIALLRESSSSDKAPEKNQKQKVGRM